MAFDLEHAGNCNPLRKSYNENAKQRSFQGGFNEPEILARPSWAIVVLMLTALACNLSLPAAAAGDSSDLTAQRRGSAGGHGRVPGRHAGGPAG